MTIALYTRYRRTLKAMPETGRTMPYNWTALPDQLEVNWISYGWMLDEFAVGLANAINELTFHERSLRAWSAVIEALPEAKRYAVAHEFVNAPATIAVNLPYVIRERFTFATAHLCHQANQIKLSPWKDEFPLDSKITPKTVEKFGKHWTSYAPLKDALDQINADDYQTQTAHFRNIYTHRFQPRFVFGMSATVTRTPGNAGGATYSFGGAPPLQLAPVAEQLAIQRDRCYAAFEAFQILVHEQEAAIGESARR